MRTCFLSGLIKITQWFQRRSQKYEKFKTDGEARNKALNLNITMPSSRQITILTLISAFSSCCALSQVLYIFRNIAYCFSLCLVYEFLITTIVEFCFARHWIIGFIYSGHVVALSDNKMIICISKCTGQLQDFNGIPPIYG